MYKILSKTSQRKRIINTLDDKKPFHVLLNPSVLLTILFLVFHSHERLITLAGHKWYKYTELFIRTLFFTHKWRINSNSFKWCMKILTDLEFVEAKYVVREIENCLSNSIAVTCIIWRNKVLVSNTVYPYFDTNIGLER